MPTGAAFLHVNTGMALSFVELTRLQASDRPLVLVFPEPDECYAAGHASGWAECLADSDVKVTKKRGRPRKVLA